MAESFTMLSKTVILLTLIGFSVSDNASDLCPNVVSRSQWKARQPTTENFIVTPLPYVIIHHTVTPGCSTFNGCASRVRNIQDYHMDELGWDDVGFSFFIGGDGNVFDGTGWYREGAHTYGYNKKSIGIAFIGSYQRENATELMMNTAHKLITCGKTKSVLRPNVKVMGASQVTSTASPGGNLYRQIQAWPEYSATP